MIIPVRCFTCGKVTGNKWIPFRDRVSQGEQVEAVLDSLGLKRSCCRIVLTTHIDLIDKLIAEKQIEELERVGQEKNKNRRFSIEDNNEADETCDMEL